MVGCCRREGPEVCFFLPVGIVNDVASVNVSVQRAAQETLEMAEKLIDITVYLLQHCGLVLRRRLKANNNDKGCGHEFTR